MTAHLAERLTRLQDYFTEDPHPELSGRLTRMVGLTLECVGCPMVVCDRCVITGQGAGLIHRPQGRYVCHDVFFATKSTDRHTTADHFS